MPRIPSPADLAKTISDLIRRVGALEQANPLQNATVSRGGISLLNSGALKTIDTDGHLVAQIGALPSQYNRADGSAQPGMALYREDGSLAFFLGDLNPATPPYKQAVQLLDRTGRPVLADDTNSGRGLANPHVPAFALQDTSVSTWPATTANVLTNICDAYHDVQNPYLQWSITLYADAGTTGQFKLLADGNQLGTTQTVVGGTSGSFAFWQPSPVALYPTSPIGTFAHIELDAMRTAGTGSVRGICRWMTGMQSP